MATLAGLTRGVADMPGPSALGLLARRLPAWARRRTWPLVASVASIVLGMLFSFFWVQTIHSGSWTHFWLVPSDIWGVYRTAHYIGWGGYSAIYSTGVFISFPGILFLYAPLAMITGTFGMSEDFPYVLAHPTTWLVLGPYELIIGSVVLFALDSLAERLAISRARRAVLCFAEATILWIVDVQMGHPEDALALALAVYALLALWSGHTKRSGWLFGVAVLFQPLVLLTLPLLLFQTERRQRLRTLCRCVIPAAATLILPVTADWADTKRALVDQPFPFRYAHITPWTSWAPKVGTSAVAGGPGRLVALVLCVAIGWLATRRRLGMAEIIWLAAVCLALRSALDSALASYYPWPPMALALVVAATRGRSRFALTWVCAMGVTVAASEHFGPWWMWWTAVVGGLALTLIVSRPARVVVGDDTETDRSRGTSRDDDRADTIDPPSLQRDELVVSS